MGRKQKVHRTAKVSTSKQDGVTSDTVRPAGAPGIASQGRFDVATADVKNSVLNSGYICNYCMQFCCNVAGVAKIIVQLF